MIYSVNLRSDGIRIPADFGQKLQNEKIIILEICTSFNYYLNLVHLTVFTTTALQLSGLNPTGHVQRWDLLFIHMLDCKMDEVKYQQKIPCM